MSALAGGEEPRACLRRGAVGELAEPLSLDRLGRVLRLLDVALDAGRGRAPFQFS